MVRLENNINDSIPLNDMKDGQIGVIVKWKGDGYLGRIVQRHWNTLISVGMCSGKSWPNIFNDYSGELRIRLIRKDETLCVDNNNLG
jgi:hypothetical protein